MIERVEEPPAPERSEPARADGDCSCPCACSCAETAQSTALASLKRSDLQGDQFNPGGG